MSDRARAPTEGRLNAGEGPETDEGPEMDEGPTLVLSINHVQLAMPAGQEAVAKSFYSGVLGFKPVEKPEHLRARGGCWFQSEGVDLHLGVDPQFAPARKAHPAFLVRSLSEVAARLERFGIEAVEDTQLEGYQRFHCSDPFGNRLEFMERFTAP